MTRPEPDASRSAEKLRTLGHEVLVDPVLQTVFCDQPIHLPENARLVTTSRNGVRALSRLISKERRSSFPLYTVGDATAKLAREAGFLRAYSASGTVDMLVASINERALFGPLFYVCGRDRKGGLEYKLRALGWHIYVHERYRAEFSPALLPQTIRSIKNDQVEGVLLYSYRSAKALNALFERANITDKMQRLRFFCLTKNIVAAFDATRKGQFVIAAKPNEPALFECLAT